MEFVIIPAGSFMMGMEEGGDYVKPVHRVNLESFKMMTTEVTVGQFRKFVNATGYETEAEQGFGAYIWSGSDWEMMPDANWRNPYFNQSDNHPVVCLSWNDCQEYIDWLNQSDPGKGYRLPSEAEWEYACRAGTTTAYYSGDRVEDLFNAGWYDDNSEGGTHPVAEKTPNAWGLYDMHGNAFEWCQDWYHDNYEGAPSDGSPWLMPEGDRRVQRGGSWIDIPLFCQSALRLGVAPNERSYYFGFRLAANL